MLGLGVFDRTNEGKYHDLSPEGLRSSRLNFLMTFSTITGGREQALLKRIIGAEWGCVHYDYSNYKKWIEHNGEDYEYMSKLVERSPK